MREEQTEWRSSAAEGQRDGRQNAQFHEETKGKMVIEPTRMRFRLLLGDSSQILSSLYIPGSRWDKYRVRPLKKWGFTTNKLNMDNMVKIW